MAKRLKARSWDWSRKWEARYNNGMKRPAPLLTPQEAWQQVLVRVKETKK